MYLDYGDYIAMGGQREENDFERASYKAHALITRITHGRILNEKPVRDTVKHCAFELIEAMISDSLSGADGRVIASMSNDGMSVSYAGQSGNAAQVNASRYAGIVRSYLEYETDARGVFLLYAGF